MAVLTVSKRLDGSRGWTGAVWGEWWLKRRLRGAVWQVPNGWRAGGDGPSCHRQRGGLEMPPFEALFRTPPPSDFGPRRSGRSTTPCGLSLPPSLPPLSQPHPEVFFARMRGSYPYKPPPQECMHRQNMAMLQQRGLRARVSAAPSLLQCQASTCTLHVNGLRDPQISPGLQCRMALLMTESPRKTGGAHVLDTRVWGKHERSAIPGTLTVKQPAADWRSLPSTQQHSNMPWGTQLFFGLTRNVHEYSR